MNTTPTEYRLVNEIVVSHNPEYQLRSEQALNRALQYYRDSFFYSYPSYEEELGNLTFSQNLAVEAPNLPKNGEEAYQADRSYWVNKHRAGEWVQGYKDLHLVFRGIKKYSITRFIDHANVVQDFDGNINKHIPLAPNLRQEYQNILEALELPKFINCEEDWEIDAVNIIYDEDLTKSFWPPRALDKQYHLFRNGFTFEEPGGGVPPFMALNHVSDGLGLTPLVEQDLDKMIITQDRQLEIGNTLKSNYTLNQAVNPGYGFGHGGSISLYRGISPNPFVIVFLGILYCWYFVFGRGKKKKVTGKGFPPHLIALHSDELDRL
uniref:Uncharacterized protein n=1 Tax=Caulerpa cupressoides TaxID=148945 RepID=A0A3G2SDC8_9CHLO|nr:hypothetical protein [Caulerpa cupressoides]